MKMVMIDTSTVANNMMMRVRVMVELRQWDRMGAERGREGRGMKVEGPKDEGGG